MYNVSRQRAMIPWLLLLTIMHSSIYCHIAPLLYFVDLDLWNLDEEHENLIEEINSLLCECGCNEPRLIKLDEGIMEWISYKYY